MTRAVRRAGRRSASRRVRGSMVSGERTRELVLRAARQVLVRGGGADFSIRRVAAAAGITVGNLTYHFPSKRDLLRALIASLLAEYSIQIEHMFAELPAKPERALEQLIAWLMYDAASPGSSRVFRELWAMSLHDAMVARAIDEFYERAIDKVVAMLRKSFPELSESDARELVYLVALISEGTNVIYGTRARRPVVLDRLARVASTTVVQALRARLAGAPVPVFTSTKQKVLGIERR